MHFSGRHQLDVKTHSCRLPMFSDAPGVARCQYFHVIRLGATASSLPADLEDVDLLLMNDNGKNVPTGFQ